METAYRWLEHVTITTQQWAWGHPWIYPVGAAIVLAAAWVTNRVERQ